jgi:uncharacterized membrane protein YgcG
VRLRAQPSAKLQHHIDQRHFNLAPSWQLWTRRLVDETRAARSKGARPMGLVRERSLVSWHGAIVVGLAVMGGCIAATPEEQARENLGDSDLTFEQWVGTVYQEPDTGIWIVDGDTPIVTERELREFFMNHVQPGALVVAQSGGVDSKWSNAQKVNLTYCVSTSFGTRHAAAVSAMSTATAAWEAAANLDFVHVSSQDSSCTASNTSVVFDVRPTSGQPYLARAFFPNQSRSSRNVLIDSSSFGNISPWTLAGVLRHELGHALGFRHEQTRPEAGTCFEDNSWRALTPYDSKSVMHYPQCNGTNNGDLVLTSTDKAGASSLYGAPGSGGSGGAGGSGGSGGAGGSGGSGGAGGSGGSCDHDMCVAGTKLVSSCNSCVASICAADAYCCNTKWDSQCVGEVNSICGITCQTSGCVHGKCVTGAKLTASCDPCVSQICAEDPYCCNTSWDNQCVSEVASICGSTCGG